MVRQNDTIEESFSARALLKAAKEPHQSVEAQAQRFIAYAFSRLPEGEPYLLPKNPLEASRVDSICYGSRIGAEYMLPALVSSGLLGFLSQINEPPLPPATHLVYKTKPFDTFKINNSSLNIDFIYKKHSRSKRFYFVVRGKRSHTDGREILCDDPLCLPRSTDPISNAALEIAKDIQVKMLNKHRCLYDILRLGSTPRPTELQITPNDLVENRTAAVVTPSNESLVRPTFAPTGIVTENGFISAPAMLERMQLAYSLLRNGDAAGAEQLLKPYENIEPMDDDGDQWFSWKSVTVGGKHKCTLTIPESYEVNRSKEVKTWQASHEEMKYVKEQLDKGKCCYTRSAQRLIAASLVANPKLSGAGAEVMIHAATRSFLEVCGINYTEESLLNILPCKKTTDRWIENLACSVMFVCSVRMDEEDGIGIYLATDKADEKVKKGMTKLISKWSVSLANDEFPDGQVYLCVLDSDGTGSATEEGADGATNSIHKLPNHETIFLWGVMADSGGGFVREPKKLALVARNLCQSYALVGNCTLHNCQLTGTVPMKHLFEKGSVGIRSLPQMLFLGNEFQQTVLGRRLTRELLDELKGQYELELDEIELTVWQVETAKHPEMLLMKPDDARWLYTAFAVDRLERNLEPWKRLADSFLESGKHTATERDIVGNFKSLLVEPEVLVDLSLTAGFFRGYFFGHFKFLQGVDPNIGKPGFLQFHVFVRVLLMSDDLDRLAKYRNESQDEMEPFMKWVNELPSEKQEQQHKKAHDFFAFAKDELLKMFDRWIDTRLFFLAAFGEAPTGRLIARYLLSSEAITKANASSLLLPTEDAIYESPIHGCKIVMRNVCEFIADCVNQDSLTEFKKSFHFGINREYFERIAAGFNVWDRATPSAQAPRRMILIRYGGFPSNTQMLERGNKNHNICAANARKERAVNARITCRSVIVDVASVTTVDGKRDPSSGRAHTKSINQKLRAFDASETECRGRLTLEEQDKRYSYIGKKMFVKDETFEEKEYQKKKQPIDLSAESHRIPYVSELRTGYDTTPYLEGDVQYGKLRTQHVQAMKNELTARNIPFDPKDGIKKLITRLKDALRNAWITQNPGVDEKIYDEDEKETKYFKPITDISNFKYKVVQ